ncbi:MAG: 30S ribosomal protein S18 [Anaerolineae bacterium]|nr:30S ribosomal protein S18 [Anaerolineae bacterium]
MDNWEGSRQERGQSSRRRGRPAAGGRQGGRWRSRVRQCYFCSEGVKQIDYKDVDRLRRFLNNRGKIRPRRQTGACARHQRQIGRAIKRARHLALLPMAADHLRNT